MIKNDNSSKTATGDDNNIQEQQPPLQTSARGTCIPSLDRVAPVADQPITPSALLGPKITTKDNENDAGTVEPYPDWWWEIKRDRPWVIIHVEDGPPRQRARPAEPANGESDNYFQPRWLEESDR
ncbi:MAG: hypothetical protein ABMA14_16355 [Hyphomonadaceae bacterium]